jgi:hypothetical protein
LNRKGLELTHLIAARHRMPAEEKLPPDRLPADGPVAEDMQAAQARPADEYDSPWKEAIEGAFPEFTAFYFPAAHAAMAWEAEHDTLARLLYVHV